jgi:hypothetical protein
MYNFLKKTDEEKKLKRNGRKLKWRV